MRDSAFQSHDFDGPLPTSQQFSDWDHIQAIREEIEELEAELAGVKEDRDAWEAEARLNRAKLEAETFNVLQAVRDWFDRVVLADPSATLKPSAILMRRLDDIVTRVQ